MLFLTRGWDARCVELGLAVAGAMRRIRLDGVGQRAPRVQRCNRPPSRGGIPAAFAAAPMRHLDWFRLAGPHTLKRKESDMASDVNWSQAVWKEINDAVLMETGKVRTAQKVFPTRHMDNDPTQVADELINFANLSIKEGQTKPFVEISATFS